MAAVAPATCSANEHTTRLERCVNHLKKPQLAVVLQMVNSERRDNRMIAAFNEERVQIGGYETYPNAMAGEALTRAFEHLRRNIKRAIGKAVAIKPDNKPVPAPRSSTSIARSAAKGISSTAMR
jgi:hypothetical protein